MEGNKSTLWGNTLARFIDRTTMYRLMLYFLLVLFAVALVYSVTGVLAYSPVSLIWSAAILGIAAWIANTLFAMIFRAVPNHESVYITALILFFLVSPVAPGDLHGSLILAAIAFFAAASKFIFVFRKKHLFNPAAFAVALSAFVLGTPATWWVSGNLALLPFIVAGGLSIVYKIQRFGLLSAFATAVLATIIVISPDPMAATVATFAYSAIFFFAFVMLTEPLTTPPTRLPRIAYGALVGVLFAWAPTVGPLFFTPELALLAGNIFSFVVSPCGRFMLTLVSRKPLSSAIYEYRFKSDRPVSFSPGQYLEWTLGAVPLDTRGNRRYFTIASAPGDEHLALGVRFYEKPSAFKQTLRGLPAGTVISAGALAGDFTLPADKKKKLAFLAGGVGVTPFASMARHSVNAQEKRDAVLLYSSKKSEEVAYRDLFEKASEAGWKTVYILSEEVSQDPAARHGLIDADLIRREISDFKERTFYISGPHPMVEAMKKTLRGMGVSRFNIKTDFFPGLA